MAPYAVQVTYAIGWHGVTEEFSNVFHYDVDAVVQTDSGWNSLADAVVAAMRPIYSTAVSFKRVRVHGPTHLSKVEDEMRLVKDLFVSGSMIPSITVAPELAVVADVYVGRGPKGGKQFLRKYFHSCGLFSGTPQIGHAEGRTALPQATKDNFINALNGIKTITVGSSPNNVCTPKGKLLPLASTWTVNDYIHARQFRRGRKEKTAA